MKFLKNNWFFFSMIVGIVLGIIVGFAWPGATALEPLGTLFINMMFCVVVPMVFFSISSSIANMKSARRAGKLMGTTVVTFMCTTIIASVLMYVLVRFIPIYTGDPAFAHSSLTRWVTPRLEWKQRTPLSSRVGTRNSWSPMSGLKGVKRPV